MKDLYFHLGINPKSSAGEVAAALDLKPEMRVYAPILLHEKQRSLYDRTHATLSSIGRLRQRLGLDSGDSWFLQNCPDFSPKLRSKRPSQKSAEVSPQASPPEKLHNVPARKGVKTKPPARTKWLVPVALAITAIVLLVLIFTFL